MNEVYYEVMVAKKKVPMMKTAQIIFAVMAGVFVLAMMIGMWWGLVFAIAFGVSSYFLKMFGDIEFEYLYIDKELQIDRILAKNKRKRMETIDLNKMELLAPLRSHELDRFRNREMKKLDYSSGDEERDLQKYVLVAGGKQIIFEPTEEMVKTIRAFAPRKVFMY